MLVLKVGIKYNINIVAKIINNNLLGSTKREIKNYNRDFRTSDGPNTSSFINMSDIAIPYDSYYTTRIVLPSQSQDFKLNYNILESSTFLLIKVTYNGNYDNGMEDDYDTYYNQDQNTYNINYYYDGNSGITYPIGRLLLLNGSYTNKIEQIYLNNPLDYDVVLDVMQAIINDPIVHIPTSAITISNLYYSDIITNQVDCDFITGSTIGSTTGSTSFIVTEYKSSISGYTIISHDIPYNIIYSIQTDELNIIYIYTTTITYTFKFLTDLDFTNAYCRMTFVYTSYYDSNCKYLTKNNTYKNGIIVDCSDI